MGIRHDRHGPCHGCLGVHRRSHSGRASAARIRGPRVGAVTGPRRRGARCDGRGRRRRHVVGDPAARSAVGRGMGGRDCGLPVRTARRFPLRHDEAERPGGLDTPRCTGHDAGNRRGARCRRGARGRHLVSRGGAVRPGAQRSRLHGIRLDPTRPPRPRCLRSVEGPGRARGVGHRRPSRRARPARRHQPGRGHRAPPLRRPGNLGLSWPAAGVSAPFGTDRKRRAAVSRAHTARADRARQPQRAHRRRRGRARPRRGRGDPGPA